MGEEENSWAGDESHLAPMINDNSDVCHELSKIE
jgi:hypothetical protein